MRRRLWIGLAVASVAASGVLAGESSAASAAFGGANGLITFATAWPHSLTGGVEPNDATVELCGVRADGRTVRLTASPIGRAYASPAWSPSGTVLAADRTAPQVGGGVAFVGAGAPATVFEDATHAAWAPDGSRIVFSAASASGQSRILFVSSTTADQRTAVLDEAAGTSDIEPAWSPDGAWIAFSSNRDGTPNGIYLVHPDGTGLRRLPLGTAGAYAPSWSPDGKTILFARQAAGGVSTLAVADPASGDVVDLGIRAAEGVYSPDGRSIAFLGPSGIGIANADGTNQHIVYSHAEPGGLDWQPLPAGAPAPATTRPCVLYGTSSANTLKGSRFADVIMAGAGADRVSAGAGDDLISGGSGNDVIDGGPGRDVINAGAGNDTIRVRDGSRDVVSCGPGRDTVYADQFDRVGKDCEHVLRVHVRRDP